MNAETEDEPDRETGPYRTGLWARAWDWLATWMGVFPPQEILRDGLTRRLALICCNWLWPLEATVRRLIIAAALALHPAMAAAVAQGKPSRKPSQPPARRAARFRIVSIRGAGASRTPAPAIRAAFAVERHFPFPADHLLRLGAPPPRQVRQLAVSRTNPLHRRGRIHPSDPDYIPAPEVDYANGSELLFGSPKEYEPAPARESDAHRCLRYRVPIESDDSEWRRIEKEWERVLPALCIGARIVALNNVLFAPAPHIQRLARRLAADPDLAALLREAPPPLLRKPRYDRLPSYVDEDLLMLAHVATQPPDTS
jgi:hypothetical protein